MSSVDNRIVNMQFNSRDFQAGAANSAEALTNLEKTIDGMGSTGGLADLGEEVDNVATRFGALQIAGVAALATIASQATQTALNIGQNLLGSITSTIFGGGLQRARDIQQAKFQFRGLGLDVDKVMKNATTAVTGTSFALNEAATTATQFAGSGVKAGKDMTTALRGVSGVAAQTGRSYSEIGQIFAGVAGTGKVTTQDLMQFGVRGLDVTQALAKQMGVTQQQVKVMVSNGEVDFKNFAEAMDNAFGKNATQANKTFNGALANMQTALKRIGADFFTGLLNPMRDVFNGLSAFFVRIQDALAPVSKDIGKFAGGVADSIVKFLEAVKVGKVVANVIGGIKNILSPLGAIFETIGKAWLEVFPHKEHQGVNAITNISKAFEFLTAPLQLVAELIKLLEPAFVVLFSLFKAGATIVQGLVGIFVDLTQGMRDAGNSMLDGLLEGLNAEGISKAIGEFANNIINWIKDALGIHSPADTMIPIGINIVQGIAEGILAGLKFIFSALVKLVPIILSGIGTLFTSLFHLLASIDWASVFESIMNGLEKLFSGIASFDWGGLFNTLLHGVEAVAKGIFAAGKFIFAAIGKIATGIMAAFKSLFGGMDAFDWTALLNSIFAGALILSMKKVIDTLGGFLGELKGVSDRLLAPFDQLTQTLKTMQQALRAQILLDIAIAVGILAAALVALSLIGLKRLELGLGGLAGIMGLLVGSMAILARIDPENLIALSGAIALMAGAVAILAASVALLGSLDLMTLAKGLGAMAIGLAILVIALKEMSASKLSAGLPAAAAAILILAFAMNVMATAVGVLGVMDMGTLAKGIGAMGVALLIFVDALTELSALSGQVVAASTAVLIISGAMVVMATAVEILGHMDLSEIAKGLGAMGIGLLLMVDALTTVTALGPEVVGAAGSLVLLSASLLIMANAIRIVGEMKGGDIAKSLIALALGLTILLVAAAVAGDPVLIAGLGALSAAVLGLGAGLALAGAGLLAAATAFTLFATVTSAGIAVVVAALTALINLLPVFALQLANSVVVFVRTIANAAPQLRESFGIIIKAALGTLRDAIPQMKKTANDLLQALFQIIHQNLPGLRKVFQDLIDAGLAVLRNEVPNFVRTGTNIVIAVLQGMTDRMPRMVNSATDLITTFIRAVGDNSHRILNAGADAIIDFLHGIANTIRTRSSDLRAAGVDIALAIADGLSFGLLTWGMQKVDDAIQALLNSIPEWARKILDLGSPSKVAEYWGEMIVAGLVKGITDHIRDAVGATIALANAAIAAGDKVVKKAQREAEQRQIRAERAKARADIADKQAKEAEKEARQSPHNKALEQAAKDARNRADKLAKAADAAQKAADASDQHVTNVQEFRAADAQGKGDILIARAQAQSDRAVRMLARANEEAKAAQKLHGKERKDLMEQARQDALAAKNLAKASRKSRNDADRFYAEAVKDRIKSIVDARKRDAKAEREQAKFDAADEAGKAEILQSRADAAEERAAAAQEQAQALVQHARKIAKDNAARAQKMLDRAERLAQQAKDASDQAKQDRQDAQDLTDSASSSGTDSSFQLSTSDLADAASAIDRYTKSLVEAEVAAQSAQPVVQFTQYNSSPASLSETEIYRQSKNLLSAAEIKMGVNTR